MLFVGIGHASAQSSAFSLPISGGGSGASVHGTMTTTTGSYCGPYHTPLTTTVYVFNVYTFLLGSSGIISGAPGEVYIDVEGNTTGCPTPGWQDPYPQNFTLQNFPGHPSYITFTNGLVSYP
jgi:hypothetical protein